MFPSTSSRKHQDSRESKTNWFPEGAGIKCFVIFLDFHFNSKKRITGMNQYSRFRTKKNTNLIVKTTEWVIYNVFSLYYLHLFPPLLLLCSFPKAKPGSFFSGLKLLKCVTMGNTFDFIQDSRPCDQESANGSPCLIEWNSRNITIAVISLLEIKGTYPTFDF